MAGKLTTTVHQINDSATPTNNFVLKADNLGGLKLSRGNDGATSQDILVVDSNGRVAITNGINQTVSASVANTVTNKVAIVINGTTYYLLASTSGT